jgi:hypothetical protein
LTLETAAFLGAAFLVGLGAAFLRLLVYLVEAVFLVGRAFGALLRAGLFAAVALFAFGFEAGFAFTARFAVLADARLAVDRAADRRKPFVRLLLIFCLISKGCSEELSSRGIGAQLSIAALLNQLAQLFAGALRFILVTLNSAKSNNIEKHLMVIVCYVTVRLGSGRASRLRQTAPTEEVTSFRFKTCDPRKLRFGFTLQY